MALSVSSYWTFYRICLLLQEHKDRFVWMLTLIYSWKKLLLIKFVEMSL